MPELSRRGLDTRDARVGPPLEGPPLAMDAMDAVDALLLLSLYCYCLSSVTATVRKPPIPTLAEIWKMSF